MRLWIVIAAFVAFVALLAIGLQRDPRQVPSPLIGKPAPAFELPLLHEPGKTFSGKQMLGSVWVMNVWASWCPPCLVEHPVVADLARSGLAQVVGLNYKDAREDALPWLQRNGDPFKFSVYDAAGRIAIDYGVYGVPETYVIDRKGIIRYKHIGPLTPQAVEKRIRPLIEDLSKGG